MLAVTFWQSHDGLHHIFRVANFDATLRSGILFPRWAAQLGFGYGFPVTQYYAPLAYYVADAFHLAGAGYLDGIKLTYALGILASALGAYGLAREWLGMRAALLAGLAYVYYPYHLADIYMRGTLTEFTALALLPLITWSAVRIVRHSAPALRSTPGRLRRMLVFAGLLAALILTHNLTAFLFLPALALFLLIVGPGYDRTPHASRRPDFGHWIWDIAGGALLAFALSAFYWLPALSEVSWIRAGQVSSSVADVAALLTPVAQFIAPSLVQPYIADAPAQLQHPLNLVLVAMGLAALALTWRARAALSPTQRRVWLAWLLLALLATLAMLDLSTPLWSALPPLAFVQFPYRLHALLGLALPMLLGFGAESVELFLRQRQTPSEGAPRFGRVAGAINSHRAQRGGPFTGLQDRGIAAFQNIHLATGYWLLATVFVLLLASSLAALPIAPQSLPGHKEPIAEAQVNVAGMSEYDYQTALWARLYGGPWLLEYLPSWVTEAREDFFLPPPVAREASDGQAVGAQVDVVQYSPEQRVLRVQTPVPFALSFHTFYFPAWQVRVDDEPVQTLPSGPLGLVSALVPAGAHVVTLAYEGTPVQRAAQWLSLGSLVVLLAILLLAGQHRKLWFSLLLLVAAGVLGWRSFDVRMSAGPQPLQATFEDRIGLLAYQVASDAYRPGDVIDLTLYWLARQTPVENFTVFVHLDPSADLRASGVSARAGQVDMQPGFNFSPTTRWQRGEVLPDHYRLRIASNAAPGVYDLYAGLYRPQPLQNLHVLSPNAVPGDRVRLGTVRVEVP